MMFRYRKNPNLLGMLIFMFRTSVSAINWFHVDEAGTGRALLVNESVHNPNESFIDFNEMVPLPSLVLFF